MDLNKLYKEIEEAEVNLNAKRLRIGIEEARRMWQVVSLLHRGGQFRHGLVEDVNGNKWSINRYENDILTAGCRKIVYNY